MRDRQPRKEKRHSVRLSGCERQKQGGEERKGQGKKERQGGKQPSTLYGEWRRVEGC